MKKLLFIIALLFSCVAHAAYIPGAAQFLDAETGLVVPTLGADGSIRAMTYETAISLNQVAGHGIFRAFGERTAVTAVTGGNDVWQGTAAIIPIPNQTVGEQMTVVSTSASDASAGVGVQALDIHGLDATGLEVSEIVTLNGTTPVNTIRTNWRFNQSIHAQTVGTTGYAVGTITIYKTGSATTVYNQLTPGGNMSLSASRMVPFGKTLYITNLSVMGVDNTSVTVRLRSTSTFEDILTTGNFFLFKDTSLLLNSTREKNFKVPLKFPSLCIVKFTAYATTAGGSVAVNYDGWIE